MQLPLGFKDLPYGRLCLMVGGRGEDSPPAQPGCDPRKPRVTRTEDAVAKGQAEMMDGTRRL